MTFTFNINALTTDLAKVRMKIGDIDSNNALLSDEEINAMLATSTTVISAAVMSVKLILAKLARDTDVNTAGISNTRSQKTTHYRDLLRELENELRAGGTPYVGGVSIADKEDREDDDDFPAPAFSVGMDDQP